MEIVIRGKMKEGKSTMVFLISEYLHSLGIKAEMADGSTPKEFEEADQISTNMLMMNNREKLIQILKNKNITIKVEQVHR